MKPVLISVFLLLSAALFSQDVNEIIMDPELDKEVLVGNCNREGLLLPVFADYYNEGYDSYTPDHHAIKELKKKRKGIEVVVVMATWCGDTREQVPRFYKIIDAMKFDPEKVRLIAVDRAKTAGDIDISGLNIERVPTFIFYQKGRELGRIVETPVGLLERDMLLILSQAE